MSIKNHERLCLKVGGGAFLSILIVVLVMVARVLKANLLLVVLLIVTK